MLFDPQTLTPGEQSQADLSTCLQALGKSTKEGTVLYFFIEIQLVYNLVSFWCTVK